MKKSEENNQVSIIILTYNSSKYLKSCIEHIFNQDFKNFELIIVDNFSTDSTRRMLADLNIKQPKNVKIILNSENLGYNGGNLIGIQNSKGSFIALVNPDAILDESWLSNIMNTFKEDSELVAINGILQNEDKSIQSTGGVLDIYGAVEQRKTILNNENYFYCPGAAFVFKRSLLSEIELDPNIFMYYDDVDFAWQTRLRGHRIGFCGIANAIHFLGQSQPGLPVSKFYQITKNRIYVCLKNYSRNRIARRFLPIVFFVFLDSIYYSVKFRSAKYFFYMLKALGWNIANLKKLSKEREKIQKNRIIYDEEIEKFMLKNSIELSRIGKK